MSRRTSSVSSSDQYWATLPDDQIANEVESRVEEYHRSVDMNGRAELWRRAYQLYYGMDAEFGLMNSASITYGGVQGELALLHVNLFRSLIEHLLVLVTGERPSYLARAINSDSQAQAQTELAEGLVRYYMTERGFEDLASTAAENALLFGEGWVYLAWDPYKGDQYAVDPETGGVVKTGDVCVYALEPMDVIRDVRTRLHDQNWHVVRTRRNKWDLATRFPEFRDHILSADTECGFLSSSRNARVYDAAPDEVECYEFLHDRCDTLPEGRYALVVGGKALVTGPLPYRDYPLHPMVPSPEKRSAFGYSRCWDLMGLQEGADSIISNMLSSHDAFGLPNVWTERGSDLTVTDIAGGLNHLESDTKPELLQLFDLSDDSFKLFDKITGIMQELVGLNNIVRGKAEENVRTAGQAALMSSHAAQFNSKLQESFIKLLQFMCTHLVRTLQKYAQAPLIVEITGKKHRPLVKEFTGQEIGAVHKVTVELGSPLQRTTAGKMSLVESLVALSNTRGAEPLTPQQLMQVFLTGKLDPITDRPDSQRRLVERENELLLDGQPVPALFTDDHEMHIREHTELMDDPDFRLDPIKFGTVADHIQEHIQLWMTSDPNILMATGQNPPQLPPPVAGAMAAGGPAGQQMAPPAPGVNPGLDNVPTEGVPPASPAVEEAGQTMPEVP